MSDEYNDPNAASGVEEASQESQGGQQYVFKPEVRRRFMNKEGETQLLIMPAWGPDVKDHPENLTSWQPYRNPQNSGNPPKPDRFTLWVRSVRYFPFVGGVANIISPRTLNPEIKNHVLETLWHVIKTTPEWRPLAGLDPDTGKKDKNRDKNAYLGDKFRAEATSFLVNAVNPHRLAEGESDISCVYEITKNAWSGSGKPDEKDWGLMAKLQLEQQEVPADVNLYDFDRRFYWGDITDPTKGFRPCIFYKKTPPNGGLQIWTGEPQPRAPRVPYNQKYLETRARLYDPTSLFLDMSQAEVLQLVMELMAGYPALLRRAFESTVPGFNDKLIKITGLVSDSTIHQPGGVPSQPAPAASNQQQFAPPASVAASPAPAPVTPVADPKKYYVAYNGAVITQIPVSADTVRAMPQGLAALQVCEFGSQTWAPGITLTPPAPVVPPAPPAPPAPVAPPPPPVSAAPATVAPMASVAPPSNVATPPAPSAPPASVPTPGAVAGTTPPPVPGGNTDSLKAEAERIAAELSMGPDVTPAASGQVPPPPSL